jgi:4-amino-4-deoxy-L-arabinose transferase-like glycosyltransferase
VKRALEILTRPRHFPWIVLALALLVVLPRLGSYGFWEPREIAVADAARKWIDQKGKDRPAQVGEEAEAEPSPPPEKPQQPPPSAEPGMSAEPGISAEPGVEAQPVKKVPSPHKTASRAPTEPRFTERLVAWGIERGGFSELGARWPLALLALIAVMAAYLLGTRLASPRAGLIGAIALLTCPYLVLEGRQLTSDIAAIAGSTLIALGLTGLSLSSRWQALVGEEKRDRSRSLVAGALVAGDLAALAAGVLLAREAAGDLLGLVPPMAGFGIGALAWALLSRRRRIALQPVVVVGALALAIAVGALCTFLYQHFSWVEAGPGDRHLFGWTLDADPKRIAALGAPWKDAGDVQVPFSAAFEQVAFGLYPWVALAPLALVWLLVGAGRSADEEAGLEQDSAALPAGHILFAWTALALLVTTIAIRKVTPVLFPAVAASAVAVGIWLDALLARRAKGDADKDSLAGSLPLLALFVLLAAIVIGKDIASQPEEFTSLTAAGQVVKYPEGAKLHLGVFALGSLFGLCAAVGLFFWRGPYRIEQRGRDLVQLVSRWALHAAVAVSVLFALFVGQVWVPGLSARMSSRDVLARYRELRQGGDLLGILGSLGSGPTYYAGNDYQKLNNRSDLIKFLGRKERVFALTRATEMCALQKEKAKKSFDFYVVDDENVQFRLLSNKLLDGEEDLNPLVGAVSRTPPPGAAAEPLAAWEDQIQLVGIKMPKRVERGDTFEATFIYKIVKTVTRPWKVFVHIDASAPPRIIGDHPFAGGHCPISTFQPGDYVIDRFEVKVPDSANRASHAVWTGLFVGSAGNYTNMKVTIGKPDDNNRVQIGAIEVR